MRSSTSAVGGRDAQVFISYARADVEVARALRDLLDAEGWTVWWDHDLRVGDTWESTLLDVLRGVDAAVVLWTPAAARSHWVMREAEAAAARGVLLPCLLGDAVLPAPLAGFQAAVLSGWEGDPDHSGLPKLFDGLERLVCPDRIDLVRPGYDADFLGVAVELPAIPGVGDEYPYLHFSVVMNPGRRLAWYVAYNVATAPHPPERPDRWMADPTLSHLYQPSDVHFLGTGFDRGHLVSPMSVAWGEPRQAGLAIRQSYFWTNTAPQSPASNQRSWARLERAERTIVDTGRGRLTGFSGPVLDDADPLHVVTDETSGRLRARRTFRLPRTFWKLAVWSAPGDTGLLRAGWTVTNDDEAVVTSCAPAVIEALTGIEFPEAVHLARAAPTLT